MSINHLSTKVLMDMLDTDIDDDLIDDIYDELDRRRYPEPIDYDEQDRRAAAEERLEMWRNEY